MDIGIRNFGAHTARSMAPVGWRPGIGTFAVALVLALMTIQPARAACDPRDLANAVVVSLETTMVCEPVCEDKYRCYAAAILGGALTVVANREGQDRVDVFCNQIQGTANEILGEVQEVLQYQFVQDQLGEISGYLSSYAEDAQQVLAIVKCACATEKLNIKNQTSFGSCANDMLHEVGCGSIDFKTGVIESCTPGGKIIQDFFNTSWGGVKSVGCGSNLTSWLFDCGVGGTASQQFRKCFAGYQSNTAGVCYPCEQATEAHAITLANGLCGCEPAYTPFYQIRNNLPIMILCNCSAPYQQVGDRCFCPSNMRIKDDACVPCADFERYVPLQNVNGVEQWPSCQPCGLGFRQSKDDPTKCVPGWACDVNHGEVPDPDAYGKKCLTCGVRQRVVSDMPIYVHRCEDCAKGQIASPDHAQCVPQCPAGSITNPSPMASHVLGKPYSACIECAPGERAVYDRPGSSIGQCVLPSNISLPLVKKDCAEVGPNFFNDPDHPNRCLPCPEGQLPNAARNACIDRSGLRFREQRLNDAVQPQQRERRADPRLQLQRESVAPARLECPPSTKPDSRGTRCVPIVTRRRPDD